MRSKKVQINQMIHAVNRLGSSYVNLLFYNAYLTWLSSWTTFFYQQTVLFTKTDRQIENMKGIIRKVYSLNLDWQYLGFHCLKVSFVFWISQKVLSRKSTLYLQKLEELEQKIFIFCSVLITIFGSLYFVFLNTFRAQCQQGLNLWHLGC